MEHHEQVNKQGCDQSGSIESESGKKQLDPGKFLNHVEDLVYFQNLTGDITFLNNTHLKITGYTEKEFSATPDILVSLVGPEVAEQHRKFFRNNPDGIASHDTEYQIQTKSGERLWFHSKMSGIQDSNGKFIGYACIDRDITRLKQFEDVLKDLISFRDSMIDSAMVLFMVTDEDGYPIMWNLGAQKITGHSRNQVIGNPHIWESLYQDPDACTQIQQDFLTVLDTGKILENYETTITTRDGNEKIISWYIGPVRGKNVLTRGLVGLGHDITRRKEAEAKLELLRKNLQIEKQKLEQVLDISQEISSILELNHLIDFIPEGATRLLEAKRCSLMFLDNESKELRIVSAIGLENSVVQNTRVRFGDPVAGHVARTGQPLLVKNIETDPRIDITNRFRYQNKSFIIVPILLHNKVVGVVNVSEKKDQNHPEFNEIDLKILTMVVHQAAISIENAYYYREKKRLSDTDPMTGLYNHRYFIQRLQEEISRSNRKNFPLSLMMLDLDGFKDFNDSFGHLEGDRLLQNISAIIRNSLREFDIACRYGGDEFVVILPETEISQAESVARRIKIAVSEMDAKSEVTVSIGLAERKEGDGSNDVILKADRALYQSKSEGRNTIRCYITASNEETDESIDPPS